MAEQKMCRNLKILSEWWSIYISYKVSTGLSNRVWYRFDRWFYLYGKNSKRNHPFLQAQYQTASTKKLGLFACCYTPNGTDGFFETFFPKELLCHAFYVTAVGGEMNYEKMNVFYRKMFQALKKIDGFHEGFQEPQINRKEIQRLADAVSKWG